MTSSLVGSEMCIRDSNKTLTLGPPRADVYGDQRDYKTHRLVDPVESFGCLLYTSDAADDM
eukprot:7225028-Prorocentrum_lima.AAC.1